MILHKRCLWCLWQISCLYLILRYKEGIGIILAPHLNNLVAGLLSFYAKSEVKKETYGSSEYGPLMIYKSVQLIRVFHEEVSEDLEISLFPNTRIRMVSNVQFPFKTLPDIFDMLNYCQNRKVKKKDGTVAVIWRSIRHNWFHFCTKKLKPNLFLPTI